MSGETYTVIAAEGVHDVEAVSKILRLKGFREVKSINEIPEPLRDLVPKQYPLNNGTDLTRLIPHPSFLVRDDYWILLSNAGGESMLAGSLKELLTIPRIGYANPALRGAAILADADTKTAERKKGDIFRQLTKAFSDNDDLTFSPAGPARIELYGKERHFGTYIFPDDQGHGTLEDILIEGARVQYPELLHEAEAFIAYAENLPRPYVHRLKVGSGRKRPPSESSPTPCVQAKPTRLASTMTTGLRKTAYRSCLPIIPSHAS